MSSRLPVIKTYKLFIGGAFPRTESGRAYAIMSPDRRRVLARACRASRKDLRDAVVAARKGFETWSKRSAANRGQILYRMAEMLEHRSAEMIAELVASTGASTAEARREIQAAVDRLIWYAGWTDKFSRLFGTVNPVATSHFNFSVPEPTGVVGIIAPDEPSLLGLVSVAVPTIVGGNAIILVASEKYPLPSITFAEILATSDLPAGVINILTGFRSELVPPMARHMDINAVVDAGCDSELSRLMQMEGATNVKRLTRRMLNGKSWYSDAGQDPWWILDTLEIKTTWHPIGL